MIYKEINRIYEIKIFLSDFMIRIRTGSIDWHVIYLENYKKIHNYIDNTLCSTEFLFARLPYTLNKNVDNSRERK